MSQSRGLGNVTCTTTIQGARGPNGVAPASHLPRPCQFDFWDGELLSKAMSNPSRGNFRTLLKVLDFAMATVNAALHAKDLWKNSLRIVMWDLPYPVVLSSFHAVCLLCSSTLGPIIAV